MLDVVVIVPECMDDVGLVELDAVLCEDCEVEKWWDSAESVDSEEWDGRDRSDDSGRLAV